MSDIHATAFRYDCECMELDKKPHPYIIKMFEREKEENVLHSKDTMHLYLAGNNRLLTDIRIGDDDILPLCKTLLNNLYVTSIDLRYNIIGDQGAKHIATLIEESCTLRDINLMFNDIGPDGAESIAKALLSNGTLQSLRMTGNKIGNRGGMAFAGALQVNSTLEAIDLADTDISIESIIALCTILYHNTSIASLNVNRPILFTHQEETTVHFSKLLKVNTTLKELHLRKYDMRDFGMTRLAECLMENFTLTHLDLSSNRITRDGVKELAKVLKANTALQYIDLGYNRLEDDGAIHIAEALATYNTNLQCLVINNNNIKGPGLCAVADSIKQNARLTNIYIWGNVLDEKACIAFASLFDTGRLDIKDTDVKPYVVDGITYMSEVDRKPRRHYYWAPSYGDDVPSWQVKGKGDLKDTNSVALLDPQFINAY